MNVFEYYKHYSFCFSASLFQFRMWHPPTHTNTLLFTLIWISFFSNVLKVSGVTDGGYCPFLCVCSVKPASSMFFIGVPQFAYVVYLLTHGLNGWALLSKVFLEIFVRKNKMLPRCIFSHIHHNLWNKEAVSRWKHLLLMKSALSGSWIWLIILFLLKFI